MSNPTGLDAFSAVELTRADYPMILACKRDLAVIRPTRLVYQSGGYAAGTVLAQFTSGANNNLFTPYVNGGASGQGTAVCILFEKVVDDGATGNPLARSIFQGLVFHAKLTGIDSTAITSLGGRTFTDSSGVKLLTF